MNMHGKRPAIAGIHQRDGSGGAEPAVLARGAKATRSARMSLRKQGDETTGYSAVLSTENPVKRWGYTEVLEHTAEAVNLARAGGAGLMFLMNHDDGDYLGRLRGVRVEGAQLRIDEIIWSQNERAQAIKADVDAGILGEMSVRYSIDEYEEIERDGEIEVRVKRWTPLEGSIVTIPADIGAGIGRTASRGDGDDNVIDLGDVFKQGSRDASAGAQRGATAERERAKQIRAAFRPYLSRGAEFDTLCDYCIDNGKSVEASLRALLQLVNSSTGMGDAGDADDGGGIDSRGERGRVEQGEDQADKTRAAFQGAIEFRSGLVNVRDPAVRQQAAENPFAVYTLAEMARAHCEALRINLRGKSRDQIIAYALAPWSAPGMSRAFVGHATGAFTEALSATVNKGILNGWEEAPESWQMIVRTGSLPDYKAGKRTGLGAFSDLLTVAENGEYKHGSFTDVGEPIQLAKYGRLFAITREAILNDDLSVFTDVPRKMGRAANRIIGDQVMAVFTVNADGATLSQDAARIYAAGHNNTGTSGVLTVTTLSELDTLIGKQKSPGNNENAGMNAELKIVLVPRALKHTARILAASEFDPNASTERVPNPWGGNITVVSDARLDAASATRYYGLADPNMHPTIEVAFLNGNQVPYLESRDGWTVDGVEYKVRHEFAVAPLDYRFTAVNDGT